MTTEAGPLRPWPEGVDLNADSVLVTVLPSGVFTREGSATPPTEGLDLERCPKCGHINASHRPMAFAGVRCHTELDNGRLCRCPAATPPTEGLDVERLAMALQAWWADDRGVPGSGSWEAGGGWLGDADAIAREYVALSEPHDKPVPR